MKKIAVNTIKAFLKEHKCDGAYTQTFDVANSSFDVVFHTNLSIAEKTIFINRVLSACFDDVGNFRPEYISPMLRATVIQMCTNVPALSLKDETSESGAPVLDLDAMNNLYMAMDLDNVNNHEYHVMLDEMTKLCLQAIEWKKEHDLSNHNTDSALRNLLNMLSTKVEDLDTDALMRYANTLSEATKELEEDAVVNKVIDLSRHFDKADI